VLEASARPDLFVQHGTVGTVARRCAIAPAICPKKTASAFCVKTWQSTLAQIAWAGVLAGWYQIKATDLARPSPIGRHPDWKRAPMSYGPHESSASISLHDRKNLDLMGPDETRNGKSELRSRAERSLWYHHDRTPGSPHPIGARTFSPRRVSDKDPGSQ